jgi:hypothetical protein
MASQRESSRQMVENDFSPPDSVFVCLPAALATVMSGWTYSVSRCLQPSHAKPSYLDIEQMSSVVDLELAAELTITEKIPKREF